MLLVELGLIRWLGTQLVYLSYFSNFVLLGSFLGIGLGFMRPKDRKPVYPYAPLTLLALLSIVTLSPVEIDRSQTELIFFGAEPSGLPIWVMLPFVFIAVAAAMTAIADGVARSFQTFEPLEAYRLDIGGSILGILGFTVLSFLHAPPLAWALAVAVLFLVTYEPTERSTQGPRLAALVVVAAAMSFGSGISWSPYYKIHTFEADGAPGSLAVNVNGIPHQVADPAIARSDIYLQPYDLRGTPPDSVLVIGAGTGNDVASALLGGARSVDAVEIDPRIHEIGVQRHPDDPYGDPRVTMHVDDGRAFIEQSNRDFDVIVLGLPDSLTLVSGQSSLRLESYLFTKEAFESYRDHLTEDGVFTMYNVYRETWLRDRYAGTLQEVFGRAPCIATVDAGATLAALTVSAASDLQCATTWTPAGPVPAPATDDHPFPYLRERTIPTFYLTSIALILVASLLLVRLVGGATISTMRPFADLFAMGIAFLLLETKSVVQFALLFGTTWLVNALVFVGILASVYLAIEVARRTKSIDRRLLYVGLLASLVVAWAVPLSSLLALDSAPRFVAAVALTFAPVLLANLIFAQRFAEVASSTAAFGANLLGAMVGGLLEYVSLLTGYRSMLLVVGAVYLGAAALERGARRGQGAPVPVAA